VDVTVAPAEDGLPLCKVSAIAERHETSWLIDSLWLGEACGIIGGQPKCCKSWLGLDMAVSVASGTACLGRFTVRTPGPALVFLAEDRLTAVRSRVWNICRSRGLEIDGLDLTVITASALRLDDEEDRSRLCRSIEATGAKFLLLDPLVRLHRLDENNSRDIAGILGFLRELQRRYETAVVLTHHASKRAQSRPGQALRGSSDLHAYGDSNLYLTRSDRGIELTVEHRSAAAIDKIQLHLHDEMDKTHLAITSAPMTAQVSASRSLEEQIIAQLRSHGSPLGRADLRASLRVNNQRFGQAVTALTEQRRVISTTNGLTLAP
jgi:hypothetical protein